VIFFYKPTKFLIVFFWLKPFIDRLRMNVLVYFPYVYSIAIPIACLLVILSRFNLLKRLPNKILFLLYTSIYLLAYIRFIAFDIETVGVYIRVLFPIVFYFAAPIIFDSIEKIENYIKAVSYSGILPASFIWLEKLGIITTEGTVGKSEVIGEQTFHRMTGGYYDAFTAALPILVSLIFLLFLIENKKYNIKNTLIKYFLLLFFISALIFTYHRMTYIVIAISFIVWIISYKKIKIGVSCLALFLIVMPIIVQFSSEMFQDLKLFKSTYGNYASNYVKEQEVDPSAFHGRMHGWLIFIDEIQKASALEILLGLRTEFRVHCDYLRVILNIGILGLFLHLTILFLAAFKFSYILIRESNRFKKGIALIGTCLSVLYIAGSVTLAMGVLNTLTWNFFMLFGIVSLKVDNERQIDLAQSNLTDECQNNEGSVNIKPYLIAIK
jgi:hypothetical protein